MIINRVAQGPAVSLLAVTALPFYPSRYASHSDAITSFIPVNMSISPELIEAINIEVQRLAIEQSRFAELNAELSNLRAAAEKCLSVHDFDREPAAFAVLRDSFST